MAARKSSPSNDSDRKKSSSARQVTSLGPNDVLMGRGAVQTEYEGNRRLRKLVMEHQDAYSRSKKHKEKQQIVWAIVGTMQAQGGRFLRRVEQSGRMISPEEETWEVIDDGKLIVDKVKQLRE